MGIVRQYWAADAVRNVLKIRGIFYAKNLSESY